MMLCIPVSDDRGLDALLSAHFGSAPFFTFVDAESGRATVLANAHAKHEHGRCDPARALEGRSVDAVVCRGLGRRALLRLADQGVSVLVTRASTVSGALAEFRDGALSVLEESDACRGGGHGHAHGHGGPGPG